jgi:uncharacterized membrane protein YjjP (DUF1212 family)
MKQILQWLHPDQYIRPVRALMLGVYVATASALLALLVHGKWSDAFLLGFLLGVMWGVTRPNRLRVRKSSELAKEEKELNEKLSGRQ